MKSVLKIVVCFVLFFPSQNFAQNFGRKKETKKVWKRWNKKRDAYNPYLDKKDKHKPSAQIDKSVKRDVKKQNRRYKRELRRSKRKTSK